MIDISCKIFWVYRNLDWNDKIIRLQSFYFHRQESDIDMYNEIDYYSDHNQQQDLFRNKNFNSKKV